MFDIQGVSGIIKILSALSNLFRHLKIRKKVLFLITVIVFFSITIIYFSSYTIYANAIKLKTRNYCANIIGQMIKNTDSYFQGIESMAFSLASNSIIQNSANLQYDNYDAFRDTKYIENTLRLFVYAHKNLQIAVFMENNINTFYTLYTNINAGYNFKEDNWYKAASSSQELKTIILDNPQKYYEENNRKQVYTLIYKIENIFSRNIVGYVLMDIEKYHFEGFFKNDYLDLDNFIIFNEKDEIVYDCLENPSIKKIIDFVPDGQNWGYFDKTINNRECMVIFGTSGYTKWKMVNILPYETVLQDIDDIKTLFLLIASSLFIIAVIVSYRFAATITNPLEKLTKGMEKIKIGHFQFIIPVSSNDETGELIHNFNSMIDRIKYLMKKNETIELLKKETQLQALQQQINPHFLYNTLEIIIGLASENENAGIISVCKNLGYMFRYNLSNEKIVLIRDELNQIKSYTQVLEYRFNGKFKVEYRVNPDILEYKTVKFILQPFVENSISHGFKNILKDGLLSIRIDWYDRRILFCIWDNGEGMPQKKLISINTELQRYENSAIEKVDIPPHLGIINVFLRLKLMFKDRFRLSIESAEGGGTIVKIEIPPIT